ncbi:MAG: hypothetical protein M0Z46_19680 [Actinomycetota bacterium]|nr:hypothetical protein [Actinomycetota bacterium]
MAARTFAEMTAGIGKAVARLQSCREIVLSFVRSPDLAYITA